MLHMTVCSRKCDCFVELWGNWWHLYCYVRHAVVLNQSISIRSWAWDLRLKIDRLSWNTFIPQTISNSTIFWDCTWQIMKQGQEAFIMHVALRKLDAMYRMGFCIGKSWILSWIMKGSQTSLKLHYLHTVYRQSRKRQLQLLNYLSYIEYQRRMSYWNKIGTS